MSDPRRFFRSKLVLEVARGLKAVGVGPSDGVLLAVSGGADSTAMMAAAAALVAREGLRAQVACVDHGLRREAKRESAIVAARADSWGLPFHSLCAKVRKGAGLEARAREARYAALEVLRHKLRLSAIATAHTEDDQAETVLMRLVRGTGLRGMRAIHPRAGCVVRPMLGLTRDEVQAFLSEVGIEDVAEDAMNMDEAFLRVRVRRRLLPILREVGGPKALHNIAGFAATAAEDEALLEQASQDARGRLQLAPPRSGVCAIGLRALEEPLRRRILQALIEEMGATCDRQTLSKAQRAVASGGTCTLGSGALLHVEGGVARVVRSGKSTPTTDRIDVQEGRWTLDGPSGLELKLSSAPERAAWCDPVPVAALPLTIRRRRPGDRVEIFGHSRSLQDLLTDLKVPRERRDLLAVVCDRRGRVLSVAGVWPAAQRAKPAPGSRFLLARAARRGGRSL